MVKISNVLRARLPAMFAMVDKAASPNIVTLDAYPRGKGYNRVQELGHGDGLDWRACVI